jgi:hypothetical protein
LIQANVPLNEADILLAEYIEEHEDEFENGLFESEFEGNSDYTIALCRAYIHVRDLGVKIHECIVGTSELDESSGELVVSAEFSGWIFFSDKTNEILYDEGYSSLGAAIHNGFKCDPSQLLADIYA